MSTPYQRGKRHKAGKGGDDISDIDVDLNTSPHVLGEEAFRLPKMYNKIKKLKDNFQKVYNRLEFNQHLNNKKALFFNMRNYYKYCCDNEDVFNTLPLTFHIKNGLTDANFKAFKEYYQNE